MIRMSKTNNRFQVLFYNEANDVIATALSEAIESVLNLPRTGKIKRIKESDDWVSYQVSPPLMEGHCPLTIYMCDDAENKALFDVYDLKEDDTFKISIQILDGQDEVIESYTLMDAYLNWTKSNDLSFADNIAIMRELNFGYKSVVHTLKVI